MTSHVLPFKPIGDSVRDITTWTPSSNGADDEFDYIDISSIDRETKRITSPTRVTCKKAPSRARQLVQASDVLVSTVRPNLNGVAIVPPALDGATASTGYCVLRANPDELDSRYLYYWVQTADFVRDMIRKATGASYPAVSDRIIKESLIPLPPLPEQKRIADILDKANAIRCKRQKARGFTSEMPLSAFRETFRDYLAPESAQSLLRDVAEVVSGVAKGRKLNGADTREVPYLRVANVQAGYLDLSEIKTIPAKESEVKELALQQGDVVMTEGGDHDKLGRGALWEHNLPDCIHQNHVFRVRTDRKKLFPTFFVHYLQTELAKGYFLRCAKKTTNLASINMTQLRALPVPQPPLKLQERFDDELRTIRDVIDRQNTAQTDADCLFHSLVHRAFKGEL